MSRRRRMTFEEMALLDPTRARATVEAQRRYHVRPHPGQVEIDRAVQRFQVVRAGRRFGKTKIAARKLVRHAIKNPGSMDWWVANTYKNVRRGYKEVLRQLPPSMLAKPAPPSTSNDLILSLKNGTQIEFYSAGNPDAMAGEGVNYLVGDEAALWPEIVWNQTIRPTLADTGGSALLISTPRGRNWFWKLDQRGQDPAYPDYASWHYTMLDNPYIDPSEVDELRDTLPDVMFQQEIMAEYISSAASIFSFEDEAIRPELSEPFGQIYMGVDLARKHDFTVITASRVDDREPVYFERFTDIRWPDQRERIHDAVDYLTGLPGVDGVTVAVDSTGVGDVVYEDLEDDGMDVLGFKFSSQWKTLAVKQLAADLARGDAFIYADMVPEFESYEYNLTETGNYKFEAGDGGHDDMVSAKLLEHWAIVQESMPNVRIIDTRAIFEDPDDEAQREAEVETTLVADSPTDIMSRPESWG